MHLFIYICLDWQQWKRLEISTLQAQLRFENFRGEAETVCTCAQRVRGYIGKRMMKMELPSPPCLHMWAVGLRRLIKTNVE